MEIAKNQIEFMSKSLAEELHKTFHNPFETIISTDDKLRPIDISIVKNYDDPRTLNQGERKVIITNHSHLFYGPLQVKTN